MPMIDKISLKNNQGTRVEYDIQDTTARGLLGKKISSTVDGDSLAFTDSTITSTSIIDGPYIADCLMGITDVEVSGTTITYTLDSSDADDKTAYIWIRG